MSAEKIDKTLINIAAKKALGKAHTSNLRQTQNEGYPSNVQVSTATTFGEAVPNTVSTDTFYSIQSGTVEYIEFDVATIAGTDYDEDSHSGTGGSEASDNTYHGYELRLPATYVTNSSNTKKNTGYFKNSEPLYSSRGKLQLVPPYMSSLTTGNKYNLKLYDQTNTRIMPGDNIDWTIDYYNGVVFVQDPKTAQTPTKARAFLYIGDYADTATGGNVRVMGTSSAGQATDIAAVTKIIFDGTTGLNVTSSIPGGTECFVSLGSHYSEIQVDGQNTLFATGSEAIEFEAGSGVSITTDKTTSPVKLSFASTGILYNRTVISGVLDPIPTDAYSNSIIGIQATASLQINLPAASSYNDGQYFTFKDESGNANTHNITIAANGSDTIDGQSQIVLQSPHAAVNLYTNGTNKFFIY